MHRKRNGSSYAWRKLRTAILAQEPLCRVCMGKGRVTAASEVDHILPLHMGGVELDAGNCRPICRQCHVDVTNAAMGHRVKAEIGRDGWPVA